MARRTAWIAALLVAFAAPAAAHPAPFSYVDARIRPSSVDVSVVVHALDVAHDLGIADEAVLLDAGTLAPHAAAIVALVRERLRLTFDDGERAEGAWGAPAPLADRQGISLQVTYPVGRPPGVLTIAARMFPYDPAHQTFVNVYEADALVRQGILTARRDRIEHYSGAGQGTWSVVRRFVAAGVHHILIGPDHLLFLVGLLLLGGTLRQLVLVVSAFTLAHSVTLSLAVLDVVSPPAWVVEPAIALSIVYVGADNLMARGGRDVRAWIAFAFGLVHGFGFAYVLREIGLPPRALGWSLLSFNVGVELGQLVVVIVVASALAAVRARSEPAGRRLATAGSVVVIVAGAFWFVERVFLGPA